LAQLGIANHRGYGMLEANFRNLLFFDTLLKPHHEGLPEQIPLEGILLDLERENKVEPYVKLIDNGLAAVRLIDVRVKPNQNAAILLLQYADTRGADPVFADLKKGTLRSEHKLEGEGVAISAHLAFKIAKNASNDLYSAILEDVPGVGRTILEPFLRSAFRNASSYKFKGKNGNELKTWPVVTLVVKQSEELGKSLLHGGYITSVEVTKYTAVAGFDEIEHIEEKATTTKIKIEGRPSGEQAKALLNKIMVFANQKGYFDMRVKWMTSHKQGKQVNLGTARADAGDALYGRVERVSFSQQLPQCADKISDEMESKLLAFLA
jgi:hypothetical protein